jgi:superfamily II DNA or RNA helicase
VYLKVVIDSVLRIRDVPKNILEQIRDDLIIKNPEYILKLSIGLPTWGTPEVIELISEIETNGRIEYSLPRGYLAKLWEIADLDGNYVLDERLRFEPLVYPKTPKLRDYQAPILERTKIWQQGVVIMPCGAGKTNAALSAAAEIAQPTLWITHTVDLLEQSMERARSWLGLTGSQIGVIQGDNMRIGSHITFATVQTLRKRDLTDIKNLFGCVIVDESHLVYKSGEKARMFESVISQFPAYYRFGVTASEFRSDGLIDTMFHVIGPKIYEVTQEDLNKAGNVVVPRVEYVGTDFTYIAPEGEMLNVQKMAAEMRVDESRGKLLRNILSCDIQDGDCCIVLADSLEYLEELHRYTTMVIGRPAAYVNGSTKKTERQKIMRDMQLGRYQYLFATYQLAKLGLDIPRLNKLVLATPKRDKTSIQQAAGRIMRPFDGKPQPVIYDVWDRGVPQLKFWARDRAKVYKGLGCEVIGGPVVRK